MFGVRDCEFEKCGDVIVAPKHNIFALTCSLCHEVFMGFGEFRIHIIKEHDVYLGIDDITCGEEEDEDEEMDMEIMDSCNAKQVCNEEIAKAKDLAIDDEKQCSRKPDLATPATENLDCVSKEILTAEETSGEERAPNESLKCLSEKKSLENCSKDKKEQQNSARELPEHLNTEVIENMDVDERMDCIESEVVQKTDIPPTEDNLNNCNTNGEVEKLECNSGLTLQKDTKEGHCNIDESNCIERTGNSEQTSVTKETEERKELIITVTDCVEGNENSTVEEKIAEEPPKSLSEEKTEEYFLKDKQKQQSIAAELLESTNVDLIKTMNVDERMDCIEGEVVQETDIPIAEDNLDDNCSSDGKVEKLDDKSNPTGQKHTEKEEFNLAQGESNEKNGTSEQTIESTEVEKVCEEFNLAQGESNEKTGTSEQTIESTEVEKVCGEPIEKATSCVEAQIENGKVETDITEIEVPASTKGDEFSVGDFTNGSSKSEVHIIRNELLKAPDSQQPNEQETEVEERKNFENYGINFNLDDKKADYATDEELDYESDQVRTEKTEACLNTALSKDKTESKRTKTDEVTKKEEAPNHADSGNPSTTMSDSSSDMEVDEEISNQTQSIITGSMKTLEAPLNENEDSRMTSEEDFDKLELMDTISEEPSEKLNEIAQENTRSSQENVLDQRRENSSPNKHKEVKINNVNEELTALDCESEKTEENPSDTDVEKESDLESKKSSEDCETSQTNKKDSPKNRDRRKSIKLAEIFEDLDLELDEEDEDMKVFENLILRVESDDNSDEDEEEVDKEKEKSIENKDKTPKEVSVKEKAENSSNEKVADNKEKTEVLKTQDNIETENLVTPNKDESEMTEINACDKYTDDKPLTMEDDTKINSENTLSSEVEEKKCEPANDKTEERKIESDKENENVDLTSMAIKINEEGKETIEKSENKIGTPSRAIAKSKAQNIYQSPLKIKPVIENILVKTPSLQRKAASYTDTPRPTQLVNRNITLRKRKLSEEGKNASSPKKAATLIVASQEKCPQTVKPSRNKSTPHTVASNTQKVISPADISNSKKTSPNSEFFISNGDLSAKLNESTECLKQTEEAKKTNGNKEQKPIHVKPNNENLPEKSKAVSSRMQKTFEDNNKISIDLPKSISVRRYSSNKVEKVTIQQVEELPNLTLTPTSSSSMGRASLPRTSSGVQLLNPVVRIKRLKLQKTEENSKPAKSLRSTKIVFPPGLTVTPMAMNLKPTLQEQKNKDDEDVIDELLKQFNKEESNDSKTDETFLNTPQIQPFNDEYDLELLSKVGLGIIIDPQFDSKYTQGELKMKQTIAEKFANLLFESTLVNKTPDKDSDLSEKFINLLKAVNDLTESDSNLKIHELKRIIFLLSRWYSEIMPTLLFQKNNIPKALERYTEIFYFMPKTNKRIYYCEYCNMWTNGNQMKMEVHRKIHFEPANSPICTYCFKVFKRATSLKPHMEKCKLKAT